MVQNKLKGDHCDWACSPPPGYGLCEDRSDKNKDNG
jgi:hypothetical protein